MWAITRRYLILPQRIHRCPLQILRWLLHHTICPADFNTRSCHSGFGHSWIPANAGASHAFGQKTQRTSSPHRAAETRLCFWKLHRTFRHVWACEFNTDEEPCSDVDLTHCCMRCSSVQKPFPIPGRAAALRRLDAGWSPAAASLLLHYHHKHLILCTGPVFKSRRVNIHQFIFHTGLFLSSGSRGSAGASTSCHRVRAGWHPG